MLRFTVLCLAFVLVAVSSLRGVQSPTSKPGQAPSSQPRTTSPRDPSSPLERLEGRAGYSVGLRLGRQLATFEDEGVEIDFDSIVAGIRDGMAGKNALGTDQAVGQALQELTQLRRELRKRNEEERRLGHLAAGEAFQKEFGKKTGAVTLVSGLQYRVIRAGSGESPQSKDAVRFHYRGRKVSGEEFETSRGAAALERPLSALLLGWQEALPRMKQGAKWELCIPADLAYGDNGRPPAVEPGETLIYEIELLKVVPRGR